MSVHFKASAFLTALFIIFCAAGWAEDSPPVSDALLGGGRAEKFESEEAFFEKHYEEKSDKKSGFGHEFQEWLSASRFTFRHEYSYKIEKPSRTVNNRSFLRFELSRSLGENFFLRIDSKINLFYRDDHRVRSDLEKKILIESEGREAYVQAGFGNIALKLGYQVLVWGEADGRAVTDVVSPRDMSEFIFIPLEDFRVSQFMLVVDQYDVMGGDLTLFYIPEAGFDRKPYPEGEYNMNFFPEIPIKTEEYGDKEKLNEYGLRWKISSGKSDVALMIASLIENTGAYEGFRFGSDLTLRLRRADRRYLMTGLAFNYVAGAYLWKGEIASKSRRTFNDINFRLLERHTLDSAFGVERVSAVYSLGADIFHSHVFDWSEGILLHPENRTNMAVNWNKRFLNDDLSVTVSAMFDLNDHDKIYTLESGYDYDDRTKLEFNLAIMDITKKTGPLWAYRDQSRATARFSYLF